MHKWRSGVKPEHDSFWVHPPPLLTHTPVHILIITIANARHILKEEISFF